MPITESPLRYPGGKTQLSNFLINLLDINGLNRPIYCEPFSGGFGAGMQLLHDNYVDKVMINDIDTGIYSIWYAILNECSEFIKLIYDTPITIQEWHNQKAIYNELNATRKYSIELAFATYFLNRTNVSGIISGGPIGGQDQTSKYKIDCRFNKKNLVKKIKKINLLSNRIELSNLEANDLIKEKLLNLDPKRLFVFFDPPYYKQGKNLYTNFFDHHNHVKLKKHISLMDNYKWITTYDYVDDIKYIYSDYPALEYSIRYSANKVRKEKEYLFHSPETIVESFDKVELY